MSTTSISNTTNNKSIFDKIKVGDYLSETQYYNVTGIEGQFVKLKNERGFEFSAQCKVVEEGMYTCNQYEKEEKVSRTKLVELLEASGKTIFTVNFHKKPNQTTISDKLLAVNADTFSDKNSLKKLANQLLLGEERTLVGYLVNTEPKLGRSQVVDLKVETGKHNLRLVDHRTINWLILKNVKYIV